MLLRTDLTKKVGGFDEDFFMYGEDMDLSYRMITDGMENYYLPIPIVHYKGECTKTESLNYVKIFYEAMHIFLSQALPSQFLDEQNRSKSSHYSKNVHECIFYQNNQTRCANIQAQAQNM